MLIVPTLNFGGNCREAIHLYEKAFNGKLNCLITFGETNDPEYNSLLKEEQKEYILLGTCVGQSKNYYE